MIPRWLVRLVIAAIVMATLALAVSVALWFDARDARSDQARQICESRNQERRVHRQNLTDQIDQTRGFPDVVFEKLQVDRQDAIDRLKSRRQKLHRLACNP